MDLDENSLSKISFWIKIIGFVIVFTVLIGGLSEILRFLIKVLQVIVMGVKYAIKMYRKYCDKQSKIKPIDFENNRKNRV